MNKVVHNLPLLCKLKISVIFPLSFSGQLIFKVSGSQQERFCPEGGPSTISGDIFGYHYLEGEGY